MLQSEKLSTSRIRVLPDQFKSLKPQAYEAVLSYVKGPSREEDYGEESLESLRQLTGVCTLYLMLKQVIDVLTRDL